MKFFESLPKDITNQILNTLTTKQAGIFSQVNQASRAITKQYRLDYKIQKEIDHKRTLYVTGIIFETCIRNKNSIWEEGCFAPPRNGMEIPSSEVLDSFNKSRHVQLFESAAEAALYIKSLELEKSLGEWELTAPVYKVEVKRLGMYFTKNIKKSIGEDLSPTIIDLHYLTTTPDNCKILGYQLMGKEVDLTKNNSKSCSII